MYCKVSILFAYIAVTYMTASLFYLSYSKIAKIGTPFKDKLEEYKDLNIIYKKSAEKRRMIFCISLLVAIMIVVIIQPFSLIDNDTNKLIKEIQEIFVENF
uniref:Uncharacterized protein n=1 Tax=viral metagenome TaxID=1070528 RepID=A0A6C0J3D2_9ZZZZ